MRQGAYIAYAERNRGTRFIVVWSMHWQLIWFERHKPGTNLSGAMDAAVAMLAADGWIAETDPTFTCCFVRREDVRRLLMLTPRNPVEVTLQSFNPHRIP